MKPSSGYQTTAGYRLLPGRTGASARLRIDYEAALTSNPRTTAKCCGASLRFSCYQSRLASAVGEGHSSSASAADRKLGCGLSGQLLVRTGFAGSPEAKSSPRCTQLASASSARQNLAPCQPTAPHAAAACSAQPGFGSR